jgi:uncharacterized protein (DUF488 family)
LIIFGLARAEFINYQLSIINYFGWLILMKIYTTGYTGKAVEQLSALLDFYEAVLADIRFAPHSRHLQWTKNYLTVLLKNRYRHVPSLGNRNYKTGGIQIHNLELGIRLLESWKENVVLMCACAELENCHRRVVKNEFERRGFETEEILSWDVSQPSLFGD